MIAVLMGIAQLFNAILSSHSNLILIRMGQRARASLQTLVYSKSLRLSQPARAEFSDGQIKNMMQIDAARLGSSAGLLLPMSTNPNDNPKPNLHLQVSYT